MRGGAVDLRTLPLGYRQIDYIVNSDAFVNLADGAVRSGKSIAGLVKWLEYVAKAGKGGHLLVCAKTFDTLSRNVFGPLMDPDVFGPLAKSTSYTRGAPTGMILGRKVECITFNDARSEGRLRGLTAAGTYVDEWSLMPESFHEQLIGRHSISGSQLFGNTNPDNPQHWLMKDWIVEARPGGRLARDWRVTKFVLDDNPGLSEAVKERYHRQYTGLWYRRNILGEWCISEGAVFAMWDPAKHVVSTLPRIVRTFSLGVDYGDTNPFAAIILGLGEDGLLYLVDEWRWDNKKRGRTLTQAEYSAHLREWMDTNHYEPEMLCIDPSAAGFRRVMFRDGYLPMMANNDVLSGIRLMAALLSEGLLKVHKSCAGFIEEAPAYSWDTRAALLGVDRPIKVADHSLDAGRYAIITPETFWRPSVRGALELAA